MRSPQKIETLNDLLAEAGRYAEFCMRSSGRMPPTLFLIADTKSPLIYIPENLADGNDKDNFANTARLLCIAYGAVAVVMALEAWMKMAKPGEKFDMTEPPSEAFDRQEVIVLMGEDRAGQKQKFLPIIRSDNERFFGFGESEMPIMDKMEGRFAQILSPKVPEKDMQMLAKIMLQVKGVSVTSLGKNVPLTRPRR